jgi:hypothetical protein
LQLKITWKEFAPPFLRISENWEGYVEHMRQMRIYTEFSSGNLKEIDPALDWTIIQKLILRKQILHLWFGLIWLSLEATFRFLMDVLNSIKGG